jgi:hypothetical protein
VRILERALAPGLAGQQVREPSTRLRELGWLPEVREQEPGPARAQAPERGRGPALTQGQAPARALEQGQEAALAQAPEQGQAPVPDNSAQVPDSSAQVPDSSVAAKARAAQSAPWPRSALKGWQPRSVGQGAEFACVGLLEARRTVC